MLIYALDGHDPAFGQALAASLDTRLAPHEERRFDDGERKLRPLTDPAGADAYVVQRLHGGPIDSPHDKLLALLMFVATLRDHGAARVTAVLPYLAYARKDRRTQPLDPLAQRCVAQLLESVGTGQVMVLEVHNLAAFENAFRIPTRHLAAHRLFDAVAAGCPADAPLVVASPDPGGVKRAQLWREHLERRLQRPVGWSMVDKRRSGGVLGGTEQVTGEVDGAHVLLLDDLIATGHTLQRAALALRAAGARRVTACAAHGLFMPPAAETLADDAIDAVVVSDSVPPFRVPAQGALRDKLHVVSCVRQVSIALRQSHAAWQR